MPTVPVYDQPSQGLNSGGFTAAQAPQFENYAPKQGESLGQTVGAIGKAAMQIAQYAQDKNDDAKTKELFNNAAAEIDQARIEYLNTSGKNAVDGLAGYKSKIAEIIKSQQEKAENSVQAGMFSMSAATISRSAISAMQEHQLKELGQYDLNETQKKITNGINAAVTHFGKTDQDTYTTSVYNDINHYSDSQGWAADSAQRQAMINAANDKMIEGAVKSAIAQSQPSRAKLFLDDATRSGVVSEAMHTELSSLLQTKTTQDTAANLSLGLKGSLPQKLKTLDQMFKNNEITVEERDAAKSYIEHDAAIAEREKNKAEASIRGQAQDWVINNPGVPITKMPTALYAQLKYMGELSSLDALASREGKPAERIKELQVRGQLLQLASQDPDAFIKKFNETGFTGETDIGVAGIKEMQNMATQMIQGSGTYSKGFETKLLQDAIPADLLKGSNKDKKDAFVALQAEAIARWKKDNPGKMPTIEEQKRVAQEANAAWVQIGRMWNTDIKAYEARSSKDIKAVPADFYDDLSAQGFKDDQILEKFRKYQSNQMIRK